MGAVKKAIFMLIFGNESYIVAACASAYLHKKIINKLKLDIELVIMTDDVLYKYKDELLDYFDDVKLVDMLELKLKLHKTYKYAPKYSSSMEYFTNKFHILKYEEYDIVLFIDIDVLPCNDKFYTVFEITAPAFLVKQKTNNFNKDFDKSIITNKSEFSESQYYNASGSFKSSIDASLMLFRPSVELFNEYKLFLKICEHTDGYISAYRTTNNLPTINSGPDETTIILFYAFYKKIICKTIPFDFCVTPWKYKPNDGYNEIYAINYLSNIKPWLRANFLGWPEEQIWHIIIKKIIISPKLKNIYESFLIKYIINFVKVYKKQIHKSVEMYNLDCVKQYNLFRYTKKLISYVISNEHTLDNDKIFKMGNKIFEKMPKKPILQYNKYIITMINQAGGNENIFENKFIKYITKLLSKI